MKPTAVPSPKPREKGIPIKYGRVTNQDFKSGLERLKMFTDFADPLDIWRMAKFVKTFEAIEARARKWYRGLIDKHSEKEPIKKMSKITNQMEDARDEKTGKPLLRPRQGPGPNGQIGFIFKDQAAFNADIKVFDNHIETVKVFRFKAEDFVKARLTPVELAACVMMIDNPPEELQDAVDDFEEEMIREELDDDEESTDEEETAPEAPVPTSTPAGAEATEAF